MRLCLPQIVTMCACLMAPFSASGEDGSSRPTSRHGALKVIEVAGGPRLCDAKGKPVQLRGMSTHGLQWFGWGKGITAKSLDVLAKEWKSDVLRLAMYPDEGGYKTNPKRFRAMIDKLVDETLKRGMYCIIDWHILNPGDPWRNIAQAKEFFAYMSKKHGKKKYVLYEICNEPNGKEATWPRIKAYAQQIIPVIRRNDRDGIIIVGTPAWSSLGKSGPTQGKGLGKSPLTGRYARNVVYSFHFFAGSHKEAYRKHLGGFLGKLPIFVSEWGAPDHTGEGNIDVAETNAWLSFLEQHKISWCNWNYSDEKRSGSVWKTGTLPGGPLTDANLKESGRLVKKWILKGRE